MLLTFNLLLKEAGLSPMEVRLLRHKDPRADRGRTPYELWRDDRTSFESYPSIQSINNRSKLQAKYWASFVGTPDDGTLLAGLYNTTYAGLLEADKPKPHMGGVDRAGTCDRYTLSMSRQFADFDGRLSIDWGDGKRSWIQLAHKQIKPIIELRTMCNEPEFPGYLSFIEPLSRLNLLPSSWIAALKASRGVYLLACPRTKEQYVGKADGCDGFWGRWQLNAQNAHGETSA